MEQVVNLILLFFTYSIAGWCMEVALKYRQYHRFINRGFLTGPWLPIYGSGAVLITLAVNALSAYEHSVGTTFLVSFVLCGVVEYGASWFMEKKFHARWWDYSNKPMNLNGRVWIGNLILFGLAGVLIERFSNPLLLNLFSKINLTARGIIAGLLTATMAADYVVTHFVLKLVKTGVEHSEADNTEEISKEVRLLLSDRNYFYKRFADAYPDVIYKTERITERMNAIRAETEKYRREAEARRDAMNQKLHREAEARREAVSQKLEQSREQLAASLETSGNIRNSLVRDQQALIDLLYDEQSATDEMRTLKGNIDKNRERLKARHAL